MNETVQLNPDAPVWAREEAFPEAPQGWGWVDAKNGRHPCDSRESLIAAIRNDRDGSVNLVWSPDHRRMFLPEELEGAGDALRAAREVWTRDDEENSAHRMRWFGLILALSCAYTFFQSWRQSPAGSGEWMAGLKAIFGSTSAGLALLMFIILAFIPWYQARKRRKQLGRWSEESLTEVAPTLRFETWLACQKAPLTRVFLGLMVAVAVTQLFAQVRTAGLAAVFSLFHVWEGIAAAGLVKERYFHGEWWRLFTAPFLHGNVVHFLMNMAALLYLGKRLEVFARWPHLVMVFLFSASIGGEASARFVSAPTVGASGGLMGWLGFLMVFETLHKGLVPRRARRRLAAGVALTALIGLIGYKYIDNAAHAGGLLAGMIYAVIVFPPSSSPHRPRSTVTDLVAGGMAMLVLSASAFFAIARLMAG
ncbi:MAG: rhomboid family intramembrane serine protease [Verrucomicrobiaceae bacterium]|nr:MAG: rhomboid family intramembrane serine protease [Verrucomicrobiaceae bacterium]